MSPHFDRPAAAVRKELGVAEPGRRRRPVRLLRLAATTALLWGLASERSEAQAPYRQELIPGFSTLDVGDLGTPALADLDHDGDLDAIVGQQYGGLRYFINAGSSLAPVFVEATGTGNPFTGIFVGSFSNPTLADIDGDGDLDAVVGERYGALRYLANTGSSSAPSFVETAGTDNPFSGIAVAGRSSPELVDLDGDGDLDSILGSYYGTVGYFANTGSSSAPAFLEATGTDNPFSNFDPGDRSTPELVDLDGDGDLDAVIGEQDGTLRYYLNIGSSSAPAFLAATGTDNPFGGIDVGQYSCPELVDLDGDGDLDAVVGERFRTLRYFANTGSSSIPIFLEATDTGNPLHGISVAAASSPDLVDLDGDGDLDAIVGQSSGALLYVNNTGSSSDPAFLATTGVANPFDGIDVGFSSRPVLGDLDGDGDLDAIVGEYYGTLRYFTNTASSLAPAFIEATGTDNPLDGVDIGYSSSPELVDLDGDGDLDVIIGERYGTLRPFVNSGSSSAPAFIEAIGTDNPFAGLDVGNWSAAELVDLDADGDLEALVGEQYGSLQYYLNTGSSSAPAFLAATGSDNPFDGIDVGDRSSPRLVDLDGDGDLDALVGDRGGRIIFFRSLAADVFADGFESADTSRWSATLPP